jgi:hypothetical protein
MRLKCAAAIWLLAEPCKQTNRTVGLSDAPGNPTTSTAVAGVERARWKNLRMKTTSPGPNFPREVERVIGFHLPFPGIGFVERTGSTYRFVPG